MTPYAETVVSTGEESRALELSVQWGSLGELIAEEKVRISLAYPKALGSPEILHDVVDGGKASEGVWTYRVALNPGEESETIAVLLEALRPAVWGAQLLGNLPEL